MKLALIGGGGVRSPLFVASALRRAERVGLEELCLMDTDAEKLAIFGELCREVTRRAESDVRITTSGVATGLATRRQIWSIQSCPDQMLHERTAVRATGG